MALSGSLETQGTYEKRKFVFSWTATQSVTDNTSTISWKLEAAGGQSGNYWYYDGPIYVYFTPSGGSTETLYSITSRTKRYKGTITTGTKVVTHLSDGTMSFTVRVNGAVYYDHAYEDATSTFTLDPIARATTPILSSYSVDFGTPITITLPRAVSSFTHNLTYYFNQDITLFAEDVGESFVWTPQASMAEQIKTAESGVCSIVCQTYNGQTLIGEKIVNVTLTCPSSWVPTISDISIEPTNVRTGDLSDKYIQNIDGVAVSITASHSGHADISSYSVVVDGKTYISASGDISTEVFLSSGTKNIQVIVTDSRSRSTVDNTNSVSVLAYASPSNVVSVHRTDSNGNQSETDDLMVVTVQSAVTSIISGGTELNSRTVIVKHKKQSASSWTTIQLVNQDSTNLTGTESTTAISVPNDETCAVEVTVSDLLSETKRTTSLSVGYCTLDFLAGGRGIAFGTTAKREGFECMMPARFGNDIQMGINLFNLTTTGRTAATVTWTVNADGSISATGATSSSNNELIIGTLQAVAGHTYVLRGCPSGGSSTKWRMYAKANNVNYFDYGEGVTFTAPINELVNIRAWVYKNNSSVDLVFRPELYDLSNYTPSVNTFIEDTKSFKSDTNSFITSIRSKESLYRIRFSTNTGTFNISDYIVDGEDFGAFLVLLRDWTVSTPRHSIYYVSFVGDSSVPEFYVGCSQIMNDGGPTLSFSGLTGTIAFNETLGGVMSIIGCPVF